MKFTITQSDGLVKEITTDENFDVFLRNASSFLKAQADLYILQKEIALDALNEAKLEQQPVQQQPQVRAQSVPQRPIPQQHQAPPRRPSPQGTPLINPFGPEQIQYVEEDPGYGEQGIEWRA